MSPRGRRPGSRAQALVIHPGDNVATALTGLAGGSEIGVAAAQGPETIRLGGDIPRGHKFALRAVPAGGPVIKYGEPIGVATRDIARGDHVHVHNVASPPRGEGS
ncbi:MAG TPA: UxaA family hydrolase [Deferrisomatales bacterium]|nr:UxaA family hydrolase [Deferrisomatales bacterium]